MAESAKKCWQFVIAGIRIQICSSLPLTARRAWTEFSESFDTPDLAYDVEYAERLPLYKGDCACRTERVAVSADRKKRFYFNPGAEELTARCIETAPGRTCITVSRAFAPWGENVNDLFRQYALTRHFPLLGRMFFHCSYILAEGNAILFTAPSGTGKTTQAELWKKAYGTPVINGDCAVLRVCGGRLCACGLPVSGSSPDCCNCTAPVKAVISLGQAEKNTLQRLSGTAAVRVFLAGTYLPREFSEEFLRVFDLAAGFAELVPVYRLDCLPDRSAAELVFTELFHS